MLHLSCRVGVVPGSETWGRAFLLSVLLMNGLCVSALAQSSVPGEVGVRDAILINYDHDVDTAIAIPYSTPTRDVFLPYIAYLDAALTPQDALMDGVILRDGWTGGGGSGSNYTGNELDSFLRDTFVRARMPFDSQVHYGIGERSLRLTFEEYVSQHGVLLQRHEGLRSAIPAQMTLTLGVKARADSGTAASLRLGVEVFNSSGEELRGVAGNPGLGGELRWSEGHDLWFSVHPPSANWEAFAVTFDVPDDSRLSIHIGRSGGSVLVDYAQLVIGGRAKLFEDHQLEQRQFNTLVAEGSFESLPDSTTWERGVRAASTRPRTTLYEDRSCAMDAIHAARLAIPNGPPQEPLRVILMLPTPRGLVSSNASSYVALARDLIDAAMLYESAWRSTHSGSNTRLRGFYLVKESIDDGLPAWHLFLDGVSSHLRARGIGLFCSPYWKGSSMTHVTPAIAEEYHQYFDAIWLQPVARDSGGVSSGGVDCDPDRLEVAAAYARSSWQASAPASRFGGVGINIERTGDLQESTAGYGRLLDYLAYGKKYGYVGLTKCYYDGTRHWHSAHSSDRILREQYDALHEFIGAGRGGYIVNGRFETTDGSRLFGWSGEYDVGFPSSSLEREHRWMNQAPGDLARSEFPIGVGPDRMVKIKFESREVTADGTDHSALVGLEFFDGSGHEVRQGSSNLNWSEYLDMWYRYVNTETSWNTWQWSFLVPSNAEYAVLHLRNWSTSATIQWDNVQGFENAPEDFLDDWHDQGPFTISEGSRPLFRRSTITVGSRLAWTIRAQVKETRDDGDPTSGLVRVDVFDGNGTLITPSEGVVAGLAWSDTYGWWYRYIPIDTDQTPSPPYENVWTDWSESFVLPGNAVSFRVYVYRWTLDDDNAIQVRGLRVLSTP